MFQFLAWIFLSCFSVPGMLRVTRPCDSEEVKGTPDTGAAFELPPFACSVLAAHGSEIRRGRGRKTLGAGNSLWHPSKRWPLAELRLPWQEGEALVKHKDGQGAQG